ncbi:MAG: DUF222 domain-containing protein, partial [Nitriliruptorales bacterium]|nr:DUF222 domain-containing protein [Nitriliruptorales bacterium]
LALTDTANAQFLAAIAPLSRKTAADDDRSPAQRRHDALATLCQQACDRGDLPTVAAQRPTRFSSARNSRMGRPRRPWTGSASCRARPRIWSAVTPTPPSCVVTSGVGSGTWGDPTGTRQPTSGVW